jgi:hypothetical protein
MSASITIEELTGDNVRSIRLVAIERGTPPAWELIQ